MRISEAEKTAIVSAVRAKDASASVYLFGSRARDDLKGGDIDLLVLSDSISFSAKLEVLIEIKSKIGEQKIDLKVIAPAKASMDPFAQSILPGAVRLSD